MKKIFLNYLFASVLAVTAFVVLAADCLPKSKIHAAGLFLGIRQSVWVSDSLAMRLIEGEAASELSVFDAEKMDNHLLSRMARRHSTDVATLYSLNRLYQKPENKRCQDVYNSFVQCLAQEGDFHEETESLKKKFLLFIPGFAYKEDTTTGADFAQQRRLMARLEVPCKLVETGEYAAAEQNAALIASEIRALSRIHRNIVLVSASKGGLETALAIGRLMHPDELSNVSAWVSVGGILNGSPIADQYLKAPKCWLAEGMLWTKGHDMDVVRDISHARRSADFSTLVFPPHLKIIHFVGVPLTAQVHKRIKSQYCSLQSHFGPNDGLTSIPDELTEQGIVISELGLDHYFKDPDIDKKTLALACLTTILAAK